MTDQFTLFDTHIGRCGIAWNGAHLSAIRLPERSDSATVARLERLTGATHRAAAPAFVSAAIDAIAAHLAGERADLDSLSLDFERVGPFERTVLIACRRIPRSETTTYGALAEALGQPQASRAVGAALSRNPWPIVVPCHRVVGANGRLGGFSAPGGRNAKLALLAIEKARVPAGSGLFDRLEAAPLRPMP